MKHNKKAKWIMLTTGAIGVALIPTAIFAPMFVSIFSPIDMSIFQLLTFSSRSLLPKGRG